MHVSYLSHTHRIYYQKNLVKNHYYLRNLVDSMNYHNHKLILLC